MFLGTCTCFVYFKSIRFLSMAYSAIQKEKKKKRRWTCAVQSWKETSGMFLTEDIFTWEGICLYISMCWCLVYLSTRYMFFYLSMSVLLGHSFIVVLNYLRWNESYVWWVSMIPISFEWLFFSILKLFINFTWFVTCSALFYVVFMQCV